MQIVRWDIGTLTCYKKCNIPKIVYIRNAFSVDIPMSQYTIGRWYIIKNALLYHIKLTRNLCDSILYTKYLERHLYRVKYDFK